MSSKYSLSFEKKKEMINGMSDDDARCPECGRRDFHSVKTMLYHHNTKHADKKELRRTEACEACGEEFVPKNSENPNKYCSEECFGLSDSGGRPSDGFVTYVCSRDGCGETNTVRRSVRRLMPRGAYCSPGCGVPRREEHWNWQGGSDRVRKTIEYKQWTKRIHESGDSCEVCGASSNLQAHHIVPVVEAPERATDVSNGRLLCGPCHSGMHPDVPDKLFL